MLIDSSALIYYLDANTRYVALATDLITRVVTGDLEGVVSTITLPEVLTMEYRRSRLSGDSLRGHLLSMPNVEWLPVTAAIGGKAAWLRGVYNLSTPDAVHAATALEADADWIATNDLRLRRLAPEGIQVWLFDDHL